MNSVIDAFASCFFRVLLVVPFKVDHFSQLGDKFFIAACERLNTLKRLSDSLGSAKLCNLTVVEHDR